MTELKYTKLNQLALLLPEGLLVDAAWLEEQGYSRALRHQYVSAGWLEQPTRGVYRRPRGALSWEQVVISLQTLLRVPVSVGGRSALELQGYAHYLPHSPRTIHLYGEDKLPHWIATLPMEPTFQQHNRHRFLPPVEPFEKPLSLTEPETSERTLPGFLRVIPWGNWRWPLVLSTPERAVLELLDELPHHESFHHADAIMESLVNLSPRRLQPLLEQATSIKVKRLFLFFADRHQHHWRHHLHTDAIDLGTGKRMLVKGGQLDPTYQITVPEDLDAVQ